MLTGLALGDLAWLALGAYAFHMMEEYQFNWRDWARAVIGLPVSWSDFYVTNGIVVVLGIVQAQMAAHVPLMPLVFAALMLINATFFHVAPFVWTRGRFSPGLLSAVVLFYPLGIAIFARAAGDGVLTPGLAIGAFVGGAVLMASPIIFLRLREKPYFQQTP
ncbi:HXXEE domain-containing protein [Xanthobacter oligotrophicus]|uniref:HXXEE domain-containing protein n=1 Tax=Xanthobacter oligotrophicus TaxID=2607286 RepID=A0ABW6ZYD7_9HYPH